MAETRCDPCRSYPWGLAVKIHVPQVAGVQGVFLPQLPPAKIASVLLTALLSK